MRTELAAQRKLVLAALDGSDRGKDVWSTIAPRQQRDCMAAMNRCEIAILTEGGKRLENVANSPPASRGGK